jgi:putative ABC transport system substrate-binding protein
MTRVLSVVMLTVAALAAPVAAEAQTGKVYRVALIFTTSPVSEMAGPEPTHPAARAFVRGLRALGYVEGQNLILEHRSAEGRNLIWKDRPSSCSSWIRLRTGGE